MAIDIKATLAFSVKCRDIADNDHGKERSAIRIDKEVWAHCRSEPVSTMRIYCSVCGTFFDSFSEFNKKHGGI